MVGNARSGNHSAVYTGPLCRGTRADGGRCHAPAMPGGLCQQHQGQETGVRIQAAQARSAKTSRYSKYLPVDLAQVVDEMLSDPDRHSMESELALIDARLVQVLLMLGTTASETTWVKLSESVAEFDLAQARKSVSRMHSAMEEIRRLVQEGASSGSAWQEIRSLIDQRRALVESEERRAITSGRAMPADQVLNLISLIGRIVTDEVGDLDARHRIAERIRDLVGTRATVGE